ncbi:MAG: cation:proton antiporter [Alphaproteobacteria bacterium]|nr:cation:proton antiporter [Alphaproteobacteria bacterium]MDA8003789.1 cation:proton antiporter [Alphaproteobacteria bacterium]MDA8005393.1 cation:proton antiporter [Alphaproteobacteria bacterium]MDA8013394.1 cation:proton antiporter [Alphaproteobacteria bacterium]
MQELHIASSLTTVATIALVVLVAGLVFARLKQPPLVAYILAGVILGPVTNQIHSGAAIEILAEFGVLMLLFVVGMKLNLAEFKKLWKLATITTIIEITGAVAIAGILSLIFNWSLGLALFFAFALALSSTAAAVQMLPSLENSKRCGQVAIAILIAQDLAVAPMIQIISTAATLEEGGGGLALSFARLVAAVALLAVFIWLLARRAPETILRRFFAALRKNEQLAPVAGLFLCFGAATVAGWLGFSAAYGAFLAGMLVGNSAGRTLILRQMEPVQSVLVMIFFFSIGLLLDLEYIFENRWLVVAALSFVMIVKTLINFLVLHRLGETAHNAFLTSTVLSNIGEFSFLLATVSISLGLADSESGKLVIAVTVLSLAVAPLYLYLGLRSNHLALYEVPMHRVQSLLRRRRRDTAEGAAGETADGSSPRDAT